MLKNTAHFTMHRSDIKGDRVLDRYVGTLAVVRKHGLVCSWNSVLGWHCGETNTHCGDRGTPVAQCWKRSGAPWLHDCRA